MAAVHSGSNSGSGRAVVRSKNFSDEKLPMDSWELGRS